MDSRGLVCAHAFQTVPSVAFGSGWALLIAAFITSMVVAFATVRDLLMKPRTRRITLLAMAAGCLVVGGLVALN